MKPLVLFTSREIVDTFLTTAINTRFNTFMAVFCAQQGLDFNRAMDNARDILREAEIPQPGDNLTEGCSPIDMTPFYTED